jgi:hypothetical protein
MLLTEITADYSENHMEHMIGQKSVTAIGTYSNHKTLELEGASALNREAAGYSETLAPTN